MKKYFIILLFMFSIKTYSQNIDFKYFRFSCGEKTFVTDSCSFYFECDCCNSCLFFEEDLTFYEFGMCLHQITTQKGTYSIKDNTLELHYNGIVIYKKTEENVFPADSTDAPYFVFYTDTISAPYTEIYKIDKCGEKPMLIHSEYDYYRCLSPESAYAGCDGNIEDMLYKYYKGWLNLLEVRHLDLLKNFNTYSQDLDSVILKKLYQIQDTCNVDLYEEYERDLIAHTGIGKGEVIYSPDDKFKIFTFLVSHYRNTDGYSMAQLQSGKFIETDFSNVISIHKTGENLYAVIDGYGGGGLIGGSTVSLSLVKIENDSLYYVPFDVESIESYIGYHTDAISLFNYWWMNSPEIKNIGGNKFGYKYGIPIEGFKISTPSNNSVYLCVEGEFTLINDKISGFNETYTIKYSGDGE